MNLSSFFDASFSVRLTLVLAHFLWQGLVVGLAAGLAMLALRRASAQVRYGVLVAALVVMAACPAITLVVLPADAKPATPDKIVSQSRVAPTGEGIVASQPLEDLLPAHEPMSDAMAVAPPRSVGNEETTAAVVSPARVWNWQGLSPLATAAYLAGVLILLGRLGLGLHGGRRLCRRATPVQDATLLQALERQARALRLRVTPAIAWCRHVVVPTVVGVLRPTILLPFALASGLTPDQLAAILAHELAHIRRYDHLVNLLQRLIEAFLFFHPAAWWLSRRIRIEREHCCDDLAVAVGGQPLTYAGSLLTVAELCPALRSQPVPEVVGLTALGRPSRLRQRITRLLGGPDEPVVRLGRSSWWSIAVVGVLALGAAVVLRDRAAGAARQVRVAEQADMPEESVGEQQPASPDLASLIEALRSGDSAIRQNAITTLSERYQPALLGLLRHEEPTVRSGAAVALGEVYPPPPGAVRALSAALEDEDYSVCEHAADALGRLGPDAREAIPSLVAVLANAQDFVGNLRVHAAMALSQICCDPETVVPALVNAAEWDAGVRIWNVQSTALSALASFGPDARDAVPICNKILAEAPKRSHNGLRYQAAVVLRQIGADALPALPALLQIVQDPQDDARVPAFVALSNLGPKATAAVPVLIEALDNDEDRYWAAMALGGIGPTAREAVPALTRLVQDPAGQERAQAALALWQINSQNQLSIPALIEMLNDEGYRVRFQSRTALATIGAPARQAAPALVEVMNDSPGVDRVIAALGLWRMDWEREKAIVFLIRELQEGNYRIEAAETLGEIGPAAKTAIPLLKTAAKDRNRELRMAATNALKKIERPAEGHDTPNTGSARTSRSPSEPGAFNDDKWGSEQDGLRTRLVLLTEKPAVGQPLKVRLELKNVGKAERKYDDQQAAANGSFTVTGPDGKAVPYIDLIYQTAGQTKTIKPGETEVIIKELDLIGQYLFDKPGRYTVRWGRPAQRRAPPPIQIPKTGDAEIDKALAKVNEAERSVVALPVSNVLPIELADGTLPPLQATFLRLREITPEKWRISLSGRVIFFTHSPTNLKKDVTTIQLWFDEKEHPPGYSLGEGANKVAVERLGKTPLGFAYLTAPARARELWPDYREKISKRIEAKSDSEDPAANRDREFGGQQAGTEFFGVHAPAQKIVYVIDRSGSMSERDRLRTAKRELLASLAKLPAEAQFQVIFYNLSPAALRIDGARAKLADATDANKALARQYVESMTAEGGTEHVAALKMALSLRADAIFLLTDSDDLRSRDVTEVTELNAGRARIHTILFGIGPEDGGAAALRLLAQSNGGSYRYVDAATSGPAGDRPDSGRP